MAAHKYANSKCNKYIQLVSDTKSEKHILINSNICKGYNGNISVQGQNKNVYKPDGGLTDKKCRNCGHIYSSSFICISYFFLEVLCVFCSLTDMFGCSITDGLQSN